MVNKSSHPYMQRALVAGSLIALASGLIGYPLVLRGQVFSGDALSHVAFTGAMFALVAGVDLRVGLFAACILVGVSMAALGKGGLADDVVTGSIFAWILGLGSLALTVYTTSRSGEAGGGGAGVSVLFGSVFGMTSSQALVAVVVAIGVVAALVLIARPLLFASVDPQVATARGVPVRVIGSGFLALVGVVAGEATQTVGALLILGLIAAPAGAAQLLDDRPFRAMWLSGGIAVASVWLGLSVAYAVPSIPPSFGIVATSTAVYLGALGINVLARRHRRANRNGARPDISLA